MKLKTRENTFKYLIDSQGKIAEQSLIYEYIQAAAAFFVFVSVCQFEKACEGWAFFFLSFSTNDKMQIRFLISSAVNSRQAAPSSCQISPCPLNEQLPLPPLLL